VVKVLKVLITDDEQMICNLIANILDWEDMGFQIIGMANTGTDAFDIIQKEKPDVVISDIRMPGYDGIQLIQKTAEAGIQAVFVMISGYKQFEYAQNAMKYGVKYYLLKPISEEKLRETMMEIGRELDVKQQKIVEERHLRRKVQEARDKMKRRFLTTVLAANEKDNLESDISRNAVNAEYNTEFKDGEYRAVFVKVDIRGAVGKSAEYLQDKIEQYVEKFGKDFSESISTYTHSGIVVLFNYKNEDEEEIKRKIEELWTDLDDYVKNFEGFSVVIGVSEATGQFKETRKCIVESMDAVKYRIKNPESKILYYDEFDYQRRPVGTIITPVKRQNYLAKIESGSAEDAAACIDEAVRMIRYEITNYSPVMLYDTLIYYVDLLNKTLDKAQKEKMEEYFEQWNERIDNERTELKLTEATKAYVTKVIQYVQEEKKDKDIRPVREVKTYLEENYHQEISLNDLADIVSLNASYLSALFKKETGMTYTEYVMFCRLEKAKELLADTGKSIAEIADAVGYHDTRHFSKLFTRNIGLKPSEYRKLYS
jgi:two-component system response regulator YesN